jgi:hypothetical protein
VTNNEGVTQAARSRVTNRRKFTTKENVTLSQESLDQLGGWDDQLPLAPPNWARPQFADFGFQLPPANYDPDCFEVRKEEGVSTVLRDDQSESCMIHEGMFTDSRQPYEYASPTAGLTLLDGVFGMELFNIRGESLTKDYVMDYCKQTQPRREHKD